MAHVRLIDIASDKPAHGAAGDHVGRKMFLRRNSRCAHYSSQAVRSDADDSLVLILVIQQRGDRPHLNRMSRGERSPSSPKVAGGFLVWTITPKRLLQNSCHDQAVEQRLGSQNTDFPTLRIVPPSPIDVGA